MVVTRSKCYIVSVSRSRVHIIVDRSAHALKCAAWAKFSFGARGASIRNINSHTPTVQLHAPIIKSIVSTMSGPTESTHGATIGTEEAPKESTEQQPASQSDNSTEDGVKPKENGTGGREEETKPAVTAAPPPPKPKYRHDWYQTPTDVYINVMIKGLKNEDVSVHFEEKLASLN